jgi:hypothetical protein
MPYNGGDHNHPAIFVRPDGKILLFCTGHDGGDITELISKNPEDISAWEAPIYPVGKGGYCYPNVIFLKDEGSKGRIYLFFRDNNSVINGLTIPYEPCFVTSDDWGQTWSEKRHLFHVPDGGYKPYVKYASDNRSVIHFAIERQNRQGDASVKPIYYMKYKNGQFLNDAGRLITSIDKLPVTDQQLDTVFYASRFGMSNTCYDIAVDAKGYPVIVFSMFKGPDVNIYWYVRQTATGWFKRPLINSGAYRGAQSGFAGGITLDHENPDILYMSRQLLKPSATPFDIMDTSYANYRDTKKNNVNAWITVDSVHEIDRWVTRDGGVSWDSVAITRGSANKNFLPCVPRGHLPGMKVDCIWLNGVYTSMSPDGYDCAVRMYPFNEPVVDVRPPVGASSDLLTKREFTASGRGIVLRLVNPSAASLRLYDCTGALALDLSALVRGMPAGLQTLGWQRCRLSGGAYVAVFSSGAGDRAGHYPLFFVK